MLRVEGTPIEHALAALLDFIGHLPLVFYNARFDSGFLKQTAAKIGMTISYPTGCALELARRTWPNQDNFNLSALWKSLHPDPAFSTAGAHRAIKDCEMTLMVCRKAVDALAHSRTDVRSRSPALI